MRPTLDPGRRLGESAVEFDSCLRSRRARPWQGCLFMGAGRWGRKRGDERSSWKFMRRRAGNNGLETRGRPMRNDRAVTCYYRLNAGESADAGRWTGIEACLKVSVQSVVDKWMRGHWEEGAISGWHGGLREVKARGICAWTRSCTVGAGAQPSRRTAGRMMQLAVLVNGWDRECMKGWSDRASVGRRACEPVSSHSKWPTRLRQCNIKQE